MYGIPADLPTHQFLNQELVSVGYFTNQIRLLFRPDLFITASNAVEMTFDARPERIVEEAPVATGRLPILVGRQVERVMHDSETLVLRFAGGASVRFVDDSPQYEVLTIRHPGGEIFV
jgi:hypothetical protein